MEAQDKSMRERKAMIGAPKQAELARKLVVLDTLLSAFAGSVSLIDVCRVVAQIQPACFEADGVGSYRDVLSAVASGRNTLAQATWERAERRAVREAATAFPADARGERSASGRRRYEARVRALRAALAGTAQARAGAALKMFESATLALKEAHYARPDGARGASGVSTWEVPDFGYQSLQWPACRWVIG